MSHSRDLQTHEDSFEHFGIKTNVIVFSGNGVIRQSVGKVQFRNSKKAHAHGDLSKNPIFNSLPETVTGIKNII